MDPTIIENIYPFSESEFYQSNMKKNVHFKKQEKIVLHRNNGNKAVNHLFQQVIINL